ncbi:hypothetical protein ABZ883_24085 [Streptomyces sp. NPDC046977]|uniref:hypothetical protein n=1 Tax=Streptomyces sp. NPDC046977 TaxID=3154703 RepID=UPI00340DF3EF
MSEEETSATGPVTYRARDLLVAVVGFLLVGLVPLTVLGLIAWPLGLLPSSAFPTAWLVVLAGAAPVAELYRTRPPGRRSAAVAAFATTLALGVLGETVEWWISPDSTLGLGSVLGALAGLFLGAAVFAWRIGHVARARTATGT